MSNQQKDANKDKLDQQTVQKKVDEDTHEVILQEQRSLVVENIAAISFSVVLELFINEDFYIVPQTMYSIIAIGLIWILLRLKQDKLVYMLFLAGLVICQIYHLFRHNYAVTTATAYACIIIMFCVSSSFAWTLPIFLFNICLFVYDKHQIEIAIEEEPREVLQEIIGSGIKVLLPIFVYCFLTLYLYIRKRDKILKQLHQTRKDLEALNVCLKNANAKLKNCLNDRENLILAFSHELRNYLNGINGNMELALEKSQQTDPTYYYIKKTKICGEILLHMLSSILDAGNVQRDEFNLINERVHFKSFVEKIWYIATEFLSNKSLKGNVIVSNEVPQYIEIDNQRLSEILVNLINNSAKFTDQGCITLKFDWTYGPLTLPSSNMRVCGYKNLDCQQKSNNTCTCGNNCHQEEKHDTEKEDATNIITTKKRNDSYINSKPDQEESTLELDSSQRVPLRIFKYYSYTQAPSTQCSFLSQHKTTFSEKELCYGNDVNNEGKDEGYLIMKIKDTGCGMTEEQKSKIFKKFSNDEIHTQGKRLGAGLGLWITNQIIEKMKGTIEVETKISKGTTFIIKIPSKKKGRPSKFSSLQTINKTELSIKRLERKLRALVVDDIAYNQKINAEFLAKCEIQTTAFADSGEKALEIIRKDGIEAFDLITMDLEMPGMGGQECIRKIRQLEVERNLTPKKIFIISGNVTEDCIKDCLNPQGLIRADRFLKKPCSVANIMLCIQQSFFSAKKVLLIENDSVNVNVMSQMIENSGREYLSVFAHSELQAIQDTKDKIGLILVDKRLALKEEAKVLKCVVEINKKHKAPIFIMTNEMNIMSKDQIINLGIKGLLHKPIPLENIMDLTKKYC